MTEQAPNVFLICNLCGERVTSVCLLSPNWSSMNQFESGLRMFREHNKEKHGIEPPQEYYPIKD